MFRTVTPSIGMARKGQIYFIQKSTDLITWKFVPFHAVGADAPLSQTMHSAVPQTFYRLVHSDDHDSELLQKIHNEAGVSTGEQIQLGFDPFAWTHTGNPGIHDAWAKKHFGTIHIDPEGDPDSDDLSNRLEFLLGTDPHSPDEGVTAASAPRRVAAHITDTTAYVVWQLSHGINPVNHYHIYRDGVLVRTQKVPSGLNSLLLGWTNSGLEPGKSYIYEVQARDTAGNLSARSPVQVTTASEPTLPEPWQAVDVGTTHGLGRSTFDSESDTFVLSTHHGEILKDFHFVHREFSGDFRLSSRVHMVEPTAKWAKAGIVISEDLSGDGRGLSYSITGNEDAQILYVPVAEGGFSAMTTPGVRTTGWLGIERRGNLWIYSASEDGQNWFVVAEEEQLLPETVFVGLGVAGNARDVTGVFSDLQLQDLNDVPHAGSGGLDSDGDGISDWEEKHIYHTDPDLRDIRVSGIVTDLEGSRGMASFGSWRTDGEALISQTVKATAEYQIEITEAGVYRIEAELAAGHNATNRTFFPVNIHLDGQLLERFNVHLPGTESALIHAATPWLEPGTHTIRLHFDNTMSHRSLAVLGLRVQSLGGSDTDADGVPAWMHNRLAATNSIDMAPTSLVSPANLEGVARYAEFFRLFVDGTETPVHPAPAFGWYADIPLDPDTPVRVSADFESGGRVESFELAWESFNLLDHGLDYDEEPLRIRTGDSLLLTAHTLAGEGAATITISRAGADPVEHSLADPAAEPVPHLFENAGIHTVTGTFVNGDGVRSEQSIDVEVVHARFSGDVVAKAFPLLPWENPLLPRNVHLVADSAVTLMDGGELPGGGSLLHIATGANHSSPLIVRLDEEGAHLPPRHRSQHLRGQQQHHRHR